MRIIEGVRYEMYTIRFRTTDGKRWRWTRLAPWPAIAAEQFDREVHDRGIQVVPGSDVVISRGAR